ncbi:MAG: SRPBCC family protein [Methylacidiphilales bacterium]|nr:SRPBCC family protein [Candidatus Methylacidiphilales bacterium]
MDKPRFVYVTYIRTTPEKLWHALTDPEFTRQFWVGSWQECSWKKGASWKLMVPDERVINSGEVLEIDPARKLVLSWKNHFKQELQGEGPSLMTYQLEPQEELVKLTVIQESDTPNSKLIQNVSNGWPMILASLKSLLETGESFVVTRTWPAGGACLSQRS